MLPVILAAMGGCAIRDQGPGDAAEPVHPPPDFYALRAAAEDELELAVLLKPADEPRGAAETALAPLIVQGVKPSAAGWKIEGTQRPARLVQNASGRLAVDASVPAVYTWIGAIELEGCTYD